MGVNFGKIEEKVRLRKNERLNQDDFYVFAAREIVHIVLKFVDNRPKGMWVNGR